MFQFPAFAPNGLCIQPPVTPSACTVATGFPIRKSQDQRSFDSFPGLIAAYHVLHRLITPRHPPYTLSSLITFVANQNARHERASHLGTESSVFTSQRLLSLCTCQRASCSRRPAQSAEPRETPRLRRGENRRILHVPLPPASIIAPAEEFFFDRCVACPGPGHIPTSWPAAGFPDRPDSPTFRPRGGASWRRPDSNRRPAGCKPAALPLSYVPEGIGDCRCSTVDCHGSSLALQRPGPPGRLERIAIRQSPTGDPALGLVGFEPTTSPLSGVRSNQLSYKPVSVGRSLSHVSDSGGSL